VPLVSYAGAVGTTHSMIPESDDALMGSDTGRIFILVRASRNRQQNGHEAGEHNASPGEVFALSLVLRMASSAPKPGHGTVFRSPTVDSSQTSQYIA